MSSLRFAFLVLGLILLSVSIVSFIRLQAEAVSEDTSEYQSAPTATPLPPTPMMSGGVFVSTSTPVPLATSALIETPVPFTPVPPTPTPLVESQLSLSFLGTPVAPLGIHVVQRREYLFCIGRAYGVLPQAIAEVNFLALDATLFAGQLLQIPDVPWVNIPPGPICTPQFKSPYSPTSVSMITTPPSLFLASRAVPGRPHRGEDGSLSRELRLVNFVLPKERVKKVGSQLGVPAVNLIPVLAAQTRKVVVNWPAEMRLGASGQVVLTFNPDTGQATVLGTTSPDQTIAAATNTREPNQIPYSSKPLVIPDVFDKYQVFATARLDAAGFSYSPMEDIQYLIDLEEGLTWRWSIKPQNVEHQELIISLRLHFEPKFNDLQGLGDKQIWSESFTVNLWEPWFGWITTVATGGLGIITTSLSIWLTSLDVWDRISPKKDPSDTEKSRQVEEEKQKE